MPQQVFVKSIFNKVFSQVPSEPRHYVPSRHFQQLHQQPQPQPPLIQKPPPQRHVPPPAPMTRCQSIKNCFLSLTGWLNEPECFPQASLTSGPIVIKSVTAVICKGLLHFRVFFPDKPFQPSLMFAGKVRSLS
jgi:hypothetical protein